MIICRHFTPQGMISVPPSKSIAQRVLMLASIASTPSEVENIGSSADVTACIDALKSIGAKIINNTTDQKLQTQNFTDKQNLSKTKTSVKIIPIDIENPIIPMTINAHESATVARMLSCILPGLYAKLQSSAEICSAIITGTGTLLKRPMDKTAKFLKALGITVSLDKDRWLPMRLQGIYKPGSYNIDTLDSSQPVSGAIIGLSLLYNDSEIFIREQPSIPYVLLTAHLANQFGAQITYDKQNTLWHIKGVGSLQGINCTIEGDWSSASLWLAAAALHGSITIDNLNITSNQPDRQLLELLTRYGADITVTAPKSSNELPQPAATTFRSESLSITAHTRNAFIFNCRDTPDLFPAACLLAAGCIETSSIYGIENLTGKESNRVEAIVTILEKLGASCSLTESALKITGCSQFTSAELVLPPDHRICMFALLAACNLAHNASLQLTIANGASFEDVIAKSYPDFINHYERIGGLLS